MYIGDVSTGALPFSGHFRRGRYLFVLHSQHPRGTVQFEQARLLFFLSYCTARQHPAQKASTQRHGQQAAMDT